MAPGKNSTVSNSSNTTVTDALHMVTAGDIVNSKTQATSSDSVSKSGSSSVAETVDKLVAVLHGVEPPQYAVSSVLLGIVPSSEVYLEGVSGFLSGF